MLEGIRLMRGQKRISVLKGSMFWETSDATGGAILRLRMAHALS